MSDLIKSNEYFYKKYGMIADGFLRNYEIKLDDKAYGFDRCTCVYLQVNNFECLSDKWKNLLIELVNHFLKKYPEKLDEVTNIKLDFSKVPLFCDKKVTTNAVEIRDGLFLNYNFTSLHYIWVIQTLIKFFEKNIKKYRFVIHQQSMNEPQEIKEAFSALVIDNFRKYLLTTRTEKTANLIIKNIEVLNRYLRENNHVCDSFFLIDSLCNYSAVKGNLLKYLKDNQIFNEKQINSADLSLKTLYSFYKGELKRNWRKDF